MQKIIVKEVRGPLGKGEKKFYAVVDEKGAEFTTFDTKIAQVTPGSVLEIEPKVEGKYVNISEWKVLEEGKPSVALSNGKPSYSKTPEQFDAERRSIEAQVAFKGIVELLKGTVIDKEHELAKAAFDWATVRLRAAPVKRAELAKTGSELPEATRKEQEGGNGFKNAGQFLTKSQEVFSLNRTQVLEHPEVKALFDAGDFNKAYLKLAEIVAAKK